MSATQDTIEALNRVADWIDAGPADDTTAMVHSAALRDAAGLIERQAGAIADLRAGRAGGNVPSVKQAAELMMAWGTGRSIAYRSGSNRTMDALFRNGWIGPSPNNDAVIWITDAGWGALRRFFAKTEAMP